MMQMANRSFMSFNRYMVECEYNLHKMQWQPCTVLIDTWWNVNKECFRLMGFSDGFNRYMVECEYILKLESKRIITSFNRYMVECE